MRLTAEALLGIFARMVKRGARGWATAMAVASLAISGCDRGQYDGWDEAEWSRVKTFGFPAALSPKPDTTNKYGDNDQAADFGHKLFFESRYSAPLKADAPERIDRLKYANDKISCATCHAPDNYFSEDSMKWTKPTSLGAGWTGRNTPSLVNGAFYTWQTWGGKEDSQWSVPANVIEAAPVLGTTRLAFAHWLADPANGYRGEYENIFGPLDPAIGTFPPTGKPGDAAWNSMRPSDKDTVTRIMANAGKALAAYTRKLLSRNAPIDRYIDGETNALYPAAKRGLRLFIGKAGCDGCHNGALFTNNNFHNTGVPHAIGGPPTPPAMPDQGRYDDLGKLFALDPANDYLGDGAFSDDPTAGEASLDMVRGTRSEAHKGAFRTKALRHVARTAPYFHNGGVATLEDVVDFYDQGGGAAGSYPGEKVAMPKLMLSSEEKSDLVTFLKDALTGDPPPVGLRKNPLTP